MKEKSFKLAPPARPKFNRENTRFISLKEMQEKDPSLKPKKVNGISSNWLLATGGVLLSLTIVVTIFFQIYSVNPEPSMKVDVEKHVDQIKIKFTPPDPLPGQYVGELKTEQEGRIPANVEENDLSKHAAVLEYNDFHEYPENEYYE